MLVMKCARKGSTEVVSTSELHVDQSGLALLSPTEGRCSKLESSKPVIHVEINRKNMLMNVKQHSHLFYYNRFRSYARWFCEHEFLLLLCLICASFSKKKVLILNKTFIRLFRHYFSVPTFDLAIFRFIMHIFTN